MQRFRQLFGSVKFPVIGMIHVRALPGMPTIEPCKSIDPNILNRRRPIRLQHSLGTPLYDGHFDAIVEQAKHEAHILKKHKLVRPHQTRIIEVNKQIKMCLHFDRMAF